MHLATALHLAPIGLAQHISLSCRELKLPTGNVRLLKTPQRAQLIEGQPVLPRRRVASPKLVMEEAPESYKDVTEVVDTCHEAGISAKCVKLRPIAVVKG